MLEVRCLNGNVEKYNKEVTFVEDRFNYLKIVFIDGTYLLQENDVVKYFNPNGTLIKFYPPEFHCSIFLDYEIIYTTKIRDELRFKATTGGLEDTFNISDGSKFRIVYNPKNNFIINLIPILHQYSFLLEVPYRYGHYDPFSERIPLSKKN